MNQTYLTLAALLPAVVLFVRVYRLDRIEKEPRALLGRLVLLGAVFSVPAALAELALEYLLGAYLAPQSMLFLLLDNFLVIALCEELAKRLPVMLAAWDHPAFDYRFDAIVYCVSSALGFAAVENILYVVQSDLRTAVARALLSVPGHFFFAVSMGSFLSRAKQAERAARPRRMRVLRRCSLLVPMLLHGFWDFFLSVGTVWATILFYVFVVAFFILADVELRRASRMDRRL